MNFCMCGTQASYPHDPACPFPLYHENEHQMAEWQAAYNLRKEVIMSEQNQSLYQRYLQAVRAHPEAYIVIKDGDRLVTFKHECWLFANTFNRMPKQVNGHFELSFTAEQAEQLKSKFDILEV